MIRFCLRGPDEKSPRIDRSAGFGKRSALDAPANWGSPGAIERVLASSAFQRSPRSSELLLYLCRQAPLKPLESISEQDIVDVYGRRPGYNTSEDAIAQVQVSQLRKTSCGGGDTEAMAQDGYVQ